MSKSENKINKRFRKIILFGVVVFFAGQLILPSIILTSHSANAQWAVFETGSVPSITEKIWATIKAAIKTAADVTYKNVLKTFVNNLAYNAAVGVASGDWGQKPLFPTNPEKLLTDTANIAAGDFLDEMANEFMGGDSTCYGYSAMSCKNDTSCPPPILDCSTAKMTAGTKSACNDSPPSMQQCIALGCKVVIAENKDTYNELKEAGFFDETGDGYYVEGAPECKNKFSLCDQPATLRLNLNILARNDIEKTFNPMTQGKCPVTSIIDNFEKQTKDLKEGGPGGLFKDLTSKQKTKLYLLEIQKTFTPEASEVGGYFSLVYGAKKNAEEAREGKDFATQLAGGISNITSEITGAVKTPAPLVESAINNVFGTSLDLQQTYTGSLIADAIGTFTSTLSNKLMTKYFKGLVSEEVTSGSNTKSGGLFSKLLGGINSGVTAAKLLFSDLQLVDYSVGGNIDIVTNLSSCPNPDKPTVDTCVIDARFATAIQQELTVQEAIDSGLLDPTRTFGYESDGSEPEYYNGYPFRSLVILRKYRIIPVGWELAAKYMQKYAPGRYSLGTLIAEYDSEDSPFYRLINPNWVLKAPALYCAKEGAGPTIDLEQAVRSRDTNGDTNIDTKDAAVNLIQRNNTYCADERLCLTENDDGSCKKYGYCIEEEPIWKFNGDSCDAQNNSCMAFDNGSAYLTNTVNYNSCSAENAGCQWYCQDYDKNSGWQCNNETPPVGGSKISFNNNVATCSAAEEGCTEFIPIGGVTGVNLVKNSGFEEWQDFATPTIATDGIRDTGKPGDGSIFGIDPINPGNSLPDRFSNWSHTKTFTTAAVPPEYLPAIQRSYAVTDAYAGQTGMRLHLHTPDGVNIQFGDAPNPDDGYYATQRLYTGYVTDNRAFTVSFYAKRAEGGNCTLNTDDIDINYVRDYAPGDNQYYGERFDVITDQWTRYATTITFQDAAARWAWPDPTDMDIYQQSFILFVRHTNNSPFDCDILIDNIQVEEGGLTEYKEYAENNQTYLTKAPEYLNCTGNSALDDPACENFASLCSVDDVGCTRYTATRTGNIINGRVTNPATCNINDPYSCDQCPAEYVGCQAFRELATERVPYRPVVDPISFVPDSGLTCSAADVGCEEYTNLEEVSAGGEGKEYYNEIRQCVMQDDPNVGTYYTWEGSDEFGYQLKDYRLKISNLAGNAPCTNMAPEDPYLQALGYSWPNCIDDVDIDRDGDGFVDELYPAATCAPAEIGVNPDCTQFFDTDGNDFYLLKSKVIYASPECKVYRNSIDSAATCNTLCSNNGSVCANDATCNELLYHLIPGQGKECNSQYVGCRAYKGNAGDNTRVIYNEDFEDGNSGIWMTGIMSNESVNVGGHSILSPQNDYLISLTFDPATYAIKFKENNSYNISFWAKAGVSDVPIAFRLDTDSATYDFPGTAVAKAGEWKQFELGPINIDRGYGPMFALLYSQEQLSGPVYFDNFAVTEITENIYQIKDSYTRCDGYENCQEYSDTQGVKQYLKSFTALCDESKVGCQAMVDTFNSSSPNVVDYNVSNAATEQVPSDRIVYLVNDANKSCSSSSKGCKKLGEPTINGSGIVESFKDVYLINDPDKYDDILCMFEENGCEEYTNNAGSKYYFKDPGQKTCEYKRVSGQNVSGWYKTNTNSGLPDCPVTNAMCYTTNSASPDSILNGTPCSNNDEDGDGNPDIDECMLDPTSPDPAMLCLLNNKIIKQPVDGWTGACSVDDSGCTEFRDPETAVEGSDERCDVNKADGSGYGNEIIECDSYYYIADDVDKSSCNGLVNREDGCRLFYDTTDNNLIYYSSLTQDGQAPVVSCDPTETICLEDSNTIIKVRQDRTCATWLECSSAIVKVTDDGKTENLCQEIAVCDKMDNDTSHCIGWAEYTNANNTFSTPEFADMIKNYSGLVLAGLDWGRRCNADPNTICDEDSDCNVGIGDICGDPQVIEGKLPVVAMEEMGSIGYSGDLISYGDFGDSEYKMNQLLLWWLTGGDVIDAVPPVEPQNYSRSVDIGLMEAPWRDRDWSGEVNVRWTEEEKNGRTPSENYNLDENNVAQIITNVGNNGLLWGGITYNLGENIIRDQEYLVSFRLRWNGEPSPLDRIRVEFGYVTAEGVEFAWQSFDDDIIPSAEWQNFILGPITAGYNMAGDEVNYAQTVLNIIQSSAGAGSIQSVEYYIDDVSLQPVLKTSEQGDYVNRTCRLYPKEDSTYCTYVDENNTTYKGWYGYCLEYDPQNTNYCINWWPVDLLMGETDVFGNLRSVGYSDRTPLYLCAEATSNYITNAAIPSNDPYDPAGYQTTGGAAHVYRETHVGVSNGNATYGYNNDSIIFDAVGRCDDSSFYSFFFPTGFVDTNPVTFGFCSSVMVRTHIRTPEKTIYLRDIERIDHLVNYSHCWSGRQILNPNNTGYAEGHRLTHFMSMTEEAAKNNQSIFGGSGCYGNVTLSQIAITNAQEGTIGGFGWGGAAVCPVSANYDGCLVWAAPMANCGGKDCYSSFITFGLYPDGYRVIRYGGAFDDSTGSNTEGFSVIWDFILKDTCTKMVEVVTADGDNAIWADHVNRDGEYSSLITGYGYGQDYAPFGGLIPPMDEACGGSVDIDDPATWDTNCNASNQQPLEVEMPLSQARGGSPYSQFYQSQNGKTCISIYRDPMHGASCVEAADCCLNDSYVPTLGTCSEPVVVGGTAVTITPRCVGNEPPSGNITNDSNLAFINVILANAQDEMQRLFVDAFTGWRYVETINSAGYVPAASVVNTWQTEYDTMPTCPYNTAVGRAVRPDYPNDYCGVPPTLEVTASGSDGSNAQFIDLGEDGGRVQFNIKMSGDKAQVPINRIEVIWNSLEGIGDPDSVILGNYDSGTITLEHVYQLPLGQTGKNFRPVFRIVDNWGWCNVPVGEGSSCPYAPANDCRDSRIDGTSCEWLNPGINIYVGL